MLDPLAFTKELQAQNCQFFAGVPDSLLKQLCKCFKDQVPEENFWITANEGAAVGMAMGHHLASGQIPVVYLQNSGLGNTLNPLISMADPLIYSLPMLMIVGWRGEIDASGEQLKDEPQHRKQGRITLAWLEASDIPYEVLPLDMQEACASAQRLLRIAREGQRPVALVVRKNSFAEYKKPSAASSSAASANAAPSLAMSREEAIEKVILGLEAAPVVSTTGMISRELFELRAKYKLGHEKDLLVVGAMGHAVAIAQGLALSRQKATYCFDGDGALLMHMGSLAISGQAASKLNNFKHIVFNNGAHDSVGGQETVALNLNIPNIAKEMGYKWAASCSSPAELDKVLAQLSQAEGPALLEVRVKKGARPELGRPSIPLSQIKNDFMKYLQT